MKLGVGSLHSWDEAEPGGQGVLPWEKLGMGGETLSGKDVSACCVEPYRGRICVQSRTSLEY